MFGGHDSPFTTMAPSADSTVQHDVHVNLKVGKDGFHVADVDEMYEKAIDAGIRTGFSPSDAPSGERYFHVIDPAGHELSFVRKILGHPRWGDDLAVEHV